VCLVSNDVKEHQLFNKCKRTRATWWDLKEGNINFLAMEAHQGERGGTLRRTWKKFCSEYKSYDFQSPKKPTKLFVIITT
jgi:hypothetical protein